MTHARYVLVVIACAVACGPQRPASGPPAGAGPGAVRTLDAFEDLAPWRANGSDGVTSAVRAVPGVEGKALRLELDLHNTAGYAYARRELPLELPEDFELSFDLRGAVPPNHLELKLVDASGQNVWWYRRANYEFPADWKRVTVKRRQIEFAWGPTTDKTLRKIAAIEVVIASGEGGGKGWIELDRMTLRPREVQAGPPPPLRATATSSASGGDAARAVDGDPKTVWASDPAATGAQALTIDLGRERDFGGLVVRWAAEGDGFAPAYRVELSRDGAVWEPAAAISGGNGGVDPFLLTESTGRYVRLALPARAGGYQLAEVAVLDVADGATPNAFIAALARTAPRGRYPRGMTGEQPYWTVVGTDGNGARTALLSEDGALELPSGVSIEPFVMAGPPGEVGWAMVRAAQSLDDGYLPIPTVVWHSTGWELVITAVATPDGQLAARYTLRNLTNETTTAQLVLAVRPFQVNPPTQFLNIVGGVRRIERIGWATKHRAITIEGAPAVHPLAMPDRVAMWPFHASASLGSFPQRSPFERVEATLPNLAAAGVSGGGGGGAARNAQDSPWADASVTDPAGLASGALVFYRQLAPRGSASVVIASPLRVPQVALSEAAHRSPDVWFDAQLAATRASWRAKLDRVKIRVPEAGREIVDTLRTSLAYMLLTRDGPILRPGVRSYARAWIRDGAMISEALLRLGHPEVAAEFLRWYAPYQFANGKVPCCVERAGAVPVPEHDSHGQLIFLAGELYRYTGDRAALRAVWPNVQGAVRYMDELRRSERVPANQTPARLPQYGLLPPSISHEGYSSKPAYSYWDDFWGLTGYKSAVAIATELGETAAAASFAASRDEFRRDLLASIAASAALHRTAFIPGAADLGDFDGTSTTMALSPANELAALPPALVRGTFERAWEQLIARRPGGPAWDAYTPYELRLVGSFVRLGWRERVEQSLALYLADRRPAAWNQWAEVVGRDARAPRFLGDMPHAWVHSDYARSVLDMFAYERDGGSYVLAAGVPAAWLDGTGVAVEELRTPFGPLSYQVRSTPRTVELTLAPGRVPPGGFVFTWPWPAAPPRAARLNGRPVVLGDGRELVIRERPATLLIDRSGVP